MPDRDTNDPHSESITDEARYKENQEHYIAPETLFILCAVFLLACIFQVGTHV